MARRLGDEALLLDACQVAFASTWYAGTAVQRLALVDESLAPGGGRVGNERGAVVCRQYLGPPYWGSSGGPGRMFEAAEVARQPGGAPPRDTRTASSSSTTCCCPWLGDGRPVRSESKETCRADQGPGRPGLARASQRPPRARGPVVMAS